MCRQEFESKNFGVSWSLDDKKIESYHEINKVPTNERLVKEIKISKSEIMTVFINSWPRGSTEWCEEIDIIVCYEEKN